METPFARERVRDLLRARLADALGREIEIASVDFSLLPFSVEVRGVVIGGESPDAPPFATLRRVRVEAELESFGRPEIALKSVEIEGLDVGLEFRGGREDNIPRLRGAGKGGESRLRIDGVRIDDSRVRIAERTLPLQLEARAVMARLVGAGGRDVQGDVVAQEVDLGLPRAELAPAGGGRQGAPAGRPTGDPGGARHGAGPLRARARHRRLRYLRKVDLAVTLEASGRLADRLGYLSGEIAGPVAVDGRFEWSTEAWGFRGAVESPGLDLFGFRLDAIEGSVAVEKRALRIDLARGRFEGGEAHGAFEVDMEPERYPARLEVGLAGADLGRVLDRFSLPSERLAGEVSGTFRYDLELRKGGHGVGVGDFEVLPTAVDHSAPISGDRVRRGFRLEDRRLELPSIELATPGVRAVASGAYDLATKGGDFEFEADAEDLGELVELADVGEPADLWRPSEGTGVVSGRVSLAPRRHDRRAPIGRAAVVTPGLQASRLNGTLEVGERAIEAIDLTSRGPPRASPSVGGCRSREKVSICWCAPSRWPLAQAAPWLPFEVPADGPASGTLRLAGGLDRLRGEVELAIAPAILGGIEIDRLEGSARFDPVGLEVTRAVAAAPGGSIEASGSLAIGDGALDFSFAAPAIDLGASPFAEPLAGRLGGRLSARGRVQGTLDAPRLESRDRWHGARRCGRGAAARFAAAPDRGALRWAARDRRVGRRAAELVGGRALRGRRRRAARARDRDRAARPLGDARRCDADRGDRREGERFADLSGGGRLTARDRATALRGRGPSRWAEPGGARAGERLLVRRRSRDRLVLPGRHEERRRDVRLRENDPRGRAAARLARPGEPRRRGPRPRPGRLRHRWPARSAGGGGRGAGAPDDQRTGLA